MKRVFVPRLILRVEINLPNLPLAEETVAGKVCMTKPKALADALALLVDKNIHACRAGSNSPQFS